MSEKKKHKSNIKLDFSRLFPALTHKNFRYFWFGQCISLIGTWMQNAGQSWIVLQITNSAFLLGIVNAAQFLPSLLFSLFAGAIVDRFPKKKITIITQGVLMSCAFMLTALIWTHHVKYIYILIIAFVLGLAQAMDTPARQSMMVELVGEDDLMNAIALNSAVFNGARIIGPAVAGIIMAAVGAGAAFFINGLSFIAVIYGLIKIDAANKPVIRISKNSIFSDVSEGIRYIYKTPVLYVTILLVMILSVFTQNFNTLIPALAKNVLNQKEMGYGFLMSAMGIGALFAALMLAVKGKGKPDYWRFLAGGVIMSLFAFIIGFQHSYILSSILLVLVGLGMVTFNASANSIIQVNSPDNMRGRIMSAYAFATGGMTPIGSMYAGFTAQSIGTSFAFKISGLIGIIAIIMTALYYWKMKHIRLKRTSR